MKFMVDHQLPAALSRWLIGRGEDVVHVLDLALDASPDTEIWSRARAENRIIVSKDEDFFHLANRVHETGRLRWMRLGNCRTVALLARFESAWPRHRGILCGGKPCCPAAMNARTGDKIKMRGEQSARCAQGTKVLERRLK